MLLRIDRSAGAARANDPRRREVIRRDKLRAMKREHIRERKENLANLFKEDANVDWWSLKKDWWEPLRMSKGLPPYPYDQPKLFTSYSMDGSGSYVLEDLSKYIKSIVNEDSLQAVSGLVSDSKWIKKELKVFGDVSSSSE
jgi:hypothetical protein